MQRLNRLNDLNGASRLNLLNELFFDYCCPVSILAP